MLRRLTDRIRQYFNRPSAPKIKQGAVIHNSKIGDYAYIGPQCRIFEAEIGPFVSIGPRAIIGEAEHITEHLFLSNSLLTSRERSAYDADRLRITVLEPDCWIGANSVLRKGIRIGRGAVVGAGAVVVKDVPPYAIVGGVPAKLIRMRLDKHRRMVLESSKWWELPPETLRLRIKNDDLN